MSSYITKKTPGDTRWFRQHRFGMFIHWGLYALTARNEWVKSRERIEEEKYDLYFKHFNPDLYDPSDWAKSAKAAGMKYAVLTAKHHEGFCLWDTDYTDYKATSTPAGRDLIREFVDAFRAEGIRIGFYYSLIDWHHPEFTIDMFHPRRDDADAELLSANRNMRIYAQYMRDQVTELLTNYGQIDIMWFDFSYSDKPAPIDKPWMKGKGKEDWEAEKLLATVRRLQPNIIIDNRTEIDQDFWTPEQYQTLEWVRDGSGDLVTWEACHTFSGSWGYCRDESTWKSPEMLIQMLVNSVALGGNLLMNVGPTSRGYLDHRATEALRIYEDWMRYNARSIYGCTMAEPEHLKALPQDCRMTQSEDGQRLYVHLFTYPFVHLQLHGLAGKVEYVQFLHDASELRFTEGRVEHFSINASVSSDLVVVELPPVKPQCIVPVVEIYLRET